MYKYLDDVDLCVKIYSDRKNSTDTADICRSDGAHLITLDTTKKLHAISEFVTKYSMLIKGNLNENNSSTIVFFVSIHLFLLIVFHLQTDNMWPVNESVLFQFKTLSILH